MRVSSSGTRLALVCHERRHCRVLFRYDTKFSLKIHQKTRTDFVFYVGCEIEGGTQDGIHFTFSRDGRPSGECFVEFSTIDDFNRYIGLPGHYFKYCHRFASNLHVSLWRKFRGNNLVYNLKWPSLFQSTVT